MSSRIVGMAIGATVLAASLLAIGMPRSQLRGRPQIQVGRELGYFVWMDGAVLHVRWTTPNPENHAYRGELRVQGDGALSDLQRVSLEDSDSATLESPQRLVWNATEHLGLDGIDVTVTGPAKLTLSIDSQPADKAVVFLGASRRNPPATGEIEIAVR